MGRKRKGRPYAGEKFGLPGPGMPAKRFPDKPSDWAGVSYRRTGTGNYRFVDESTGEMIGPVYRWEGSLLTHGRQYADEQGWTPRTQGGQK
jgi:hypothetical protein